MCRLVHAAFGMVPELDSVIQAVRHTYVLCRRPADIPNHRLRDAKTGCLRCASDSVAVGGCRFWAEPQCDWCDGSGNGAPHSRLTGEHRKQRRRGHSSSLWREGEFLWSLRFCFSVRQQRCAAHRQRFRVPVGGCDRTYITAAVPFVKWQPQPASPSPNSHPPTPPPPNSR